MDTHRDAVEKAVAAGRLDDSAVDAPLVALARSLAVQMDEAGERAGTRLVASYALVVHRLQLRAVPAAEAAPTRAAGASGVAAPLTTRDRRARAIERAHLRALADP